MVVVACCCCTPYRLALVLALTVAPCVLTPAPCTLTFACSACAVSLLSTGANITLAQVVVVTSYVATCAGGAFSFSHYSADSPLAHMVVSPSTT